MRRYKSKGEDWVQAGGAGDFPSYSKSRLVDGRVKHAPNWLFDDTQKIPDSKSGTSDWIYIGFLLTVVSIAVYAGYQLYPDDRDIRPLVSDESAVSSGLGEQRQPEQRLVPQRATKKATPQELTVTSQSQSTFQSWATLRTLLEVASVEQLSGTDGSSSVQVIEMLNRRADLAGASFDHLRNYFGVTRRQIRPLAAGFELLLSKPETFFITEATRLLDKEELPLVRRALVRALSRTSGSKVGLLLVRVLKQDEASFVRGEAALGLAGYSGAASINALIQALRSDLSAPVRYAAAISLGKLQATEAEQDLRRALYDDTLMASKLKQDNNREDGLRVWYGVRKAALDALDRLKVTVEPSPQTRPQDWVVVAVEQLLEKNRPLEYQIELLRMLAAVGDRRAVPALMAALKSDNRAVREMALLAAKRFGLTVKGVDDRGLTKFGVIIDTPQDSGE